MRAGHLKKVAVIGGLAAALGAAAQIRADVLFGDFENGLDPNLNLLQSNGGPNTFNGSVATNATHGAKAGSFSTAPGFQQYLNYDNGSKAPGTVAGELNNYNDLLFDINVPAGDRAGGVFLSLRGPHTA